MVDLAVEFWDFPHTYLQSSTPICILTNKEWGFLFTTNSPVFLSLILLILDILIRVRWNLKIVLVCIFLTWWGWWKFFEVLLGHFYFFCWNKNVHLTSPLRSLSYIVIRPFVFLTLHFEFFVYPGFYSSASYIAGKDGLILWAFSLNCYFLSCSEAYILGFQIPVVNCLPYLLPSRVLFRVFPYSSCVVLMFST